MTPPPHTPAAAQGWGDELRALDVAVYAAIAATPTPRLDRVFRRVSEAANHSRLWLAGAAVLAGAGGAGGRRGAADGLASVALPSAVVNLALKPFWARRRPDRAAQHVPVGRYVAMPRSTSFPSGHAASAFRVRHRRGHPPAGRGYRAQRRGHGRGLLARPHGRPLSH